MSSAGATNLVASDNTYDSMTMRHVVRRFHASLRDAEVVIVTSVTGAIGPRLLPRGPPGPKATKVAAYYHGALRAPKQYRPPPITTGPLRAPKPTWVLSVKRGDLGRAVDPFADVSVRESVGELLLMRNKKDAF